MILERLFPRREQLAAVIPGMPLTDGRLADWLNPTKSKAGVEVNAATVLSLSAVFAAVNLLSRIIGALPIDVYNRRGSSGQDVATSAPGRRLLKFQPNPEMTACVFRRTQEFSRLLFGAEAAEIEWAGNGNPLYLWPVQGFRVRPKRDENGKLYYLVDGQRRVAVEDMIYIPQVTTDGICGMSFIQFAIDSLGLGITEQQFASLFFGSGARPGGLLKHAGTPKSEARKEMRESWTREHGGPDNQHKIGVLWGGWEFVRDAGAMEPEKAQLLESRKFTTEEVSRWTGVAPHLLYDLARSTFNNIEEMGLSFVAYSLGPIVVEKEQEYDRKLFNPPSQYCKHNLDGLKRGNMAARAEFYSKLFGVGGITVNEIEQLEDGNPIGPMGDLRFVPMNMQTLEQAQKAAQEPPKPAQPPLPAPGQQPPAPTPPPVQQNSAALTLLASTFDRLLRIERLEITRAAGKPARFLALIDEFYADHRAKLAAALAPVLAVVAPSLSADTVAGVEVEKSREELLELSGRVPAVKLQDAIDTRLILWESRPTKFAADILECQACEH